MQIEICDTVRGSGVQRLFSEAVPDVPFYGRISIRPDFNIFVRTTYGVIHPLDGGNNTRIFSEENSIKINDYPYSRIEDFMEIDLYALPLESL